MEADMGVCFDGGVNGMKVGMEACIEADMEACFEAGMGACFGFNESL